MKYILIYLSYFTTTTVTPLTINTSTSWFRIQKMELHNSQIVIPTQYKNINLIYNSSLNKWLKTLSKICIIIKIKL